VIWRSKSDSGKLVDKESMSEAIPVEVTIGRVFLNLLVPIDYRHCDLCLDVPQ